MVHLILTSETKIVMHAGMKQLQWSDVKERWHNTYVFMDLISYPSPNHPIVLYSSKTK